jgi:hypothetical protein
MCIGEIVQKAVVFSRKGNNTDRAAKEWRSELAYRVLLLLRTTVANIEYPSARVPAYEIPELSGMEWQYVQPDRNFLQRTEIPYSEETDSIRVPNRMAQLVRETICSQLSRLAHPMNVQEEINMLASVDKFQEGYYGMRKFRVRTQSTVGLDGYAVYVMNSGCRRAYTSKCITSRSPFRGNAPSQDDARPLPIGPDGAYTGHDLCVHATVGIFR